MQSRGWNWRQILEHPRIGGRLTAVAVDPTDRNHIFVGTEESTIMRSLDGGVTWVEFEIDPFMEVDIDRRTALKAPGLPDIRDTPPMEYQIFMDPPFSFQPERMGIPFDSLYFSIRPEFVRGGFFPVPPKEIRDLLGNVTSSQRDQTKEVRRIAVCRGANYELLVATSQEVFGSPDDGINFVRLFAFPGEPVEVWHIVCSPGNPQRVALATELGVYLSNDGGVNWDPLGDAASFKVTALAFSQPAPGQPERLYVSDGDRLYIFGVEAGAGLEFRYPDYNDVSTAPWKDIRWVTSTSRGDVYIVAEDGVRVSRDWGYTWANPAHAMLDRWLWFQVEVGASDQPGTDRVAVLSRNCPLYIDELGRGSHMLCDNDYVYASDDQGRTWFPFFYGMSNRRFRQMATIPATADAPARWLILTEGELWASGPASRNEPSATDDPETYAWVRWAQRKLRETPPLADVTDAALSALRLGGNDFENMYYRSRFNSLLPRLDVLFEVHRTDRSRLQTQVGVDPWDRRENRQITDISAWVQMRWDLNTIILAGEMASKLPAELYRLRQDMWTITEIAWHERVLHLTRIAQGKLDAMQIASLRSRIETLEAALRIWSGRSFGDTTPSTAPALRN